MAAIIGIPPPIVKAPILAKTRNIFQRETIISGIFTVFLLFFAFSSTKLQKNVKKSSKKFGGLKKVRIFAARLRENTNSYGSKSSLKRLKESTRSKYRENTIYREALILLKNYKCQRQAKNYIEIIQ
jgi:uncharacterized membrane protein YgaE (UPF0421/DUF939 family)